MKQVTDENLALNVYNLVGQIVIESQQIETAKTVHKLSLQNAADGYYFVELLGNNTQMVEQVLIQR